MITEERMIKVGEREDIRRAYFIESKSIREIAREQHHSRKTIRKALGSAEGEGYNLSVERRSPVLGAYKGKIDQMLRENERMPRKQRYTAHKIYEEIKGEGYKGSESGVHVYVWKKRKEKKKVEVYIPLEYDPGTDAQVDWGEGVVKMGGEQVEVQLFTMRLCYSRRLFMMAFPRARQEAFFLGHVRGFQHIEGVPRRITYDNLTSAVKKVLEGKNRKEQELFIVFRSHYLFESNFCTPGEAHQKGGVEHGVGFGRRNFLVPIPEVESYEELNEHLLARCKADDERTVKGTKMSIGKAWEMERANLLSLPERDFECCVSIPATINPYSQVRFDTNRYSVPVDDAYKRLMIRAYPFHIQILHMDKVIATHRRTYLKDQEIIEPLHYLPLLERRPGAFDHAKPIRRWREKWPEVYERLLKHLRGKFEDSRGIRDFIKILKLHREYPQKKVEEAICLALEYGCGHFDGVKLCLNQLLNPKDAFSPMSLKSYPKLLGLGEQAVDVRCYEKLLGRRLL